MVSTEMSIGIDMQTRLLKCDRLNLVEALSLFKKINTFMLRRKV